MWRYNITAVELKMRNLSLRIKYSFSKINSALSIFLKIALKNFERILLVDRFDVFFRFWNWFFKVFLLNWLKNLRAQFGLYQKKTGVWTPWIIVCIGVSTPPSQKPPLLFLAKFPLKSTNCPTPPPPFRQFPCSILVFRKSPHVKVGFFSEPSKF